MPLTVGTKIVLKTCSISYMQLLFLTDDVGDNKVQEERRTYLDDLDSAYKKRVGKYIVQHSS